MDFGRFDDKTALWENVACINRYSERCYSTVQRLLSAIRYNKINANLAYLHLSRSK
jgi:hypothetical protein